jgi:hypothetical protein
VRYLEAEDMVYKFEAVCVLPEVRAEAEKLLSIDHIIEKNITIVFKWAIPVVYSVTGNNNNNNNNNSNKNRVLYIIY